MTSIICNKNVSHVLLKIKYFVSLYQSLINTNHLWNYLNVSVQNVKMSFYIRKITPYFLKLSFM